MEDSLASTISVHQLEAERLFAGAVMLDENYARETCGWLQPAILRDERVRGFWERVLAGSDAAEAALSVAAYYDFSGYMVRVTSAYDMPSFANTISADHYLIESAAALSAMARAIADRDAAKLRELSRGIAENSPTSGDAVPSAVDIGLEFQEQLDNLTGRSERLGISNLDAATGGLENQTLTVLAARPSMGKSALGIQLAKWKAEKDHKKAILFSLEMNRISIWARIACGELRYSWRDIRSGNGTQEQLQALRDKSAELMDRLENRLMVDDTASMTVEDIWRKVSYYRPALVIVDHMGLISTREENEVLALGQISRALKIMAKQFDIPIIALYQLNRGTESRDNKRPTMADIRGSGKIEENADNIFFLYRPDYYDDAQAVGQSVSKTELIIAKFRDGTRNICVKLQYHLDKQEFFPEARQ